MIGFGFASDWLRRWCKFSRPITERSKAKPNYRIEEEEEEEEETFIDLYRSG